MSSETGARHPFRIRRLLDWGGLPAGLDGASAEDSGVDPWADDAPALAGLAAASVQGLVALGRHPGTRLRRLGQAREAVERPLGDCHARWNGWIWDNAVAKSFFSSLKKERVKKQIYKTRGVARGGRRRLHRHVLQSLTPSQLPGRLQP